MDLGKFIVNGPAETEFFGPLFDKETQTWAGTPVEFDATVKEMEIWYYSRMTGMGLVIAITPEVLKFAESLHEARSA